MDKLIFDIGNTSIKACKGNGRVSCIHSTVYSKECFAKDFGLLLRKFNKKPALIFIITQNHGLLPTAKRQLSAKFGKIKIVTRGIDFTYPFKVSYSKTLGSDRYYAAAGAFYLYSTYSSILVIDMGTATTFNLISGGVFRGGMISPGLPVASRILAQSTTLPGIKLGKKINLINSDTKNAVNSGILYQQKFFIEKAISSYKDKYKELLVVITGGGYYYLEKMIDGVDVHEKNLVLEGINFITNLDYVRKK